MTQLLVTHQRHRKQIGNLSDELRRVEGENFAANRALDEAHDQIEKLSMALNEEERRLTRYRYAWMSCRQQRLHIRAETEKLMTQ